MDKIAQLILEQCQTIGALKHQADAAARIMKEKATALEADLENAELKSDLEAATSTYEQQKAEVLKAEQKLDTLKTLEKASMDRARETEPVSKGAPQYVRNTKMNQSPKILIAKGLAAKFVAHVRQVPVEQVLAEQFGKDEALKAFYNHTQKTAVAPANTFTAGWAQELTNEATAALLESLVDVSVAARLSTYGVVIPFNGQNSVKVPRVNQRTTLTEPGWTGEAGQIPLSSFSFGSTVMERTKLAAIVPATEELAQTSIVEITGLFQRELEKDYSVRLDAALLSSAAAVTGVRPAGMLEGYSALTPTVGGGVDAVVSDINALGTALANANMGINPVLILNRADAMAARNFRNDLGQFMFAGEMDQGTLMGYPVIASNNVPQHTAILVEASALAMALDAPEYRVSTEATLVEANADGTAPTHADDGSEALGTAGEIPRSGGIPISSDGLGTAAAGFSVRSLFQSYSLAVRGVFPTSFARTRPNMLAYMSATTWTS